MWTSLRFNYFFVEYYDYENFPIILMLKREYMKIVVN